MDTLHMLTKLITRANTWRLQEATNGLVKEFIWATLLQEGAPNVGLNQKEVGNSHEGKIAYFLLEVKGGNEGQTCNF